MVKYSQRNAIPPMGHSQPSNFERPCPCERYLSSHPSRCAGNAVHRSAISRECYVTLVNHLIVPPRCGLWLHCDHAEVGFDQQLLAIIEKRMDSWGKNTPNCHLEAWSTEGYVGIGNLSLPDLGSGPPWSSEAVEVAKGQSVSGSGVEPVMAILL